MGKISPILQNLGAVAEGELGSIYEPDHTCLLAMVKILFHMGLEDLGGF